MSAKEVDRAGLIRRVLERRLSQEKAAQLLGLTSRHVRRMCRAYERQGARGLISGKRGKPSNNQSLAAVREQVVALVRERYADFGPTLAAEKLRELHRFCVSKETLRKWMKAEGLWLTRKQRVPRPFQPRFRRECFGELVQIDGCDHHWFEDRGPPCSLLVYVDDATGRLMELRFVLSESTFDYFNATRSYLDHFGRPVAFYSDKHSIFRVAKDGSTGRDRGVTQFGRALAELNIDIICANTPQAKGRVERMNRTLQDRLVKELRLRGISNMEAGNAFAAEFMQDYNGRFARPPQNPHDAHRALRATDVLDHIFTLQSERLLSRELVVHHRRVTYLVVPNKMTLELRGRQVQVNETEEGTVTITHGGRALPFSVFDKQPHVAQGAIVENKHLGAVLSVIQAAQSERDRTRLASQKITLRQKARIREARVAADLPADPVPLNVSKAAKKQPLTRDARYRVRIFKGNSYVYQETRLSLGGSSEVQTKHAFVGRISAVRARAWLKHEDSSKPPLLLDGTRPPPLPSIPVGFAARKPAKRASSPSLAKILPGSEAGERVAVMTAFMENFARDQKARRRKYNVVSNQRAKERRLAVRKVASGG